jgi:hypothetical protein
VEEGGEFGEAEGEAFGGGGAEGDVAEFAAGARGFAIEVKMGIGDGENLPGVGEIADEIEHGAMAGGSCGAEREAKDGAEMVLELAGDGAFDGPVAGIVDAGSHFVGEEFALAFEEFDGEDADVLERFEDAMGGAFRGALNLGVEARGRSEGEAEDAATMVVFDERIDRRLAGLRSDS